jgi:AbrB family looped-hinge helix DNA binding protein
MKIKRTIGPKGQIVIPKDIREYLSLKPGSPVTLEVREGEVVIRPETNPEEFVKKFCEFPKKLTEKIDLKRIYEEELEERLGVH